jgi:hypothetical protein
MVASPGLPVNACGTATACDTFAGMRRLASFLAVLQVASCAPAPEAVDPSQQADADLSREQDCEITAPPPGVSTVQVVFSCGELPVGTWRVTEDEAGDSLTFALRALLAGPTPQERAAGLSSFFSEETAGMLNRAEIRGGVAFIDFGDFSRIIPNASTSAGSAELLDQLAGTIFQFDGIVEAELSFDGSCDAFWNWLQRGCERLARSGA